MKKRTSIAILMALFVAVLTTGCGGSNKINAPFESTDYKGKDLESIVSQLEAAGFTNIQTEPQETKSEFLADEVISVKIGSNKSWNSANTWKPDAPIIIQYHDYTGIRHFEVTADIAVSGEDGKPVFTVHTNLPDGTVLNAELAGQEDGNFEFFEQREIIVQGGTAATEPFTMNGETLTGAYCFAVAMYPAEQNEQVRAVIGEAGEAMQGAPVEKTDGYCYITASAEYQSPVEIAIERISEEELKRRFDEALSGFGDGCEVTLDGYMYTVNTWGDGVAETATLASLGDESAKEEWEDIVNSAISAQISLQNMLASSGYDDYMLQFQILNNQNRENVLLSVFLGMVTYNCVS